MSAPERGSLLVRETYDTKFLSVGSAVMTWIIVVIELNHLIEDRCLFFILYSLFFILIQMVRNTVRRRTDSLGCACFLFLGFPGVTSSLRWSKSRYSFIPLCFLFFYFSAYCCRVQKLQVRRGGGGNFQKVRWNIQKIHLETSATFSSPPDFGDYKQRHVWRWRH